MLLGYARSNLQVPFRISRQARVTIDAAALERDPVRPKISFLEHMAYNAQFTGDIQGCAVKGSGVAEHHQIGKPVLQDQCPCQVAECLTLPSVMPLSATVPEQRVADVEMYPACNVSALAQRFAK